MVDSETPDSGPPVAPTRALPVVEYASHTTPRRAKILSQVPAEIVAIGLAVGSALLGSTANGMARGAGLLFVPAVVAGVAWYVILRARRRKRTRLLWNVQLVLATLLCIAGTMGMVFAVEGFPLFEWWNYGRARDWADVVFFGIAWFVGVEVAAWLDRRITGYGLRQP